jgi:hypothetical protein
MTHVAAQKGPGGSTARLPDSLNLCYAVVEMAHTVAA